MPRDDAPNRGTRRLALFGAAAALLLGVAGAGVVVSGRADSPDPLVDRPVVSTSSEGPLVATSPVDPALGTVPQWRITEPGWQLTGFEEIPSFPADTDIWAAVVTDDVAAGWMIVYPAGRGIDPPIPEPEGDSVNLTNGVGVGPSQAADRDLTMNWGGYPQAEATGSASVARGAGSGRTALFHTQLDASAAVDMARTWRYVFTGPDGQALRVDVRGGGEPYYDDLGLAFPPAPADQIEGVDEDGIVRLDGVARATRNGFWVTTIEPVEPTDPLQGANELTGLVELVPDDERVEQAPVPAIDDAEIVVCPTERRLVKTVSAPLGTISWN